MRQNVIKNSSIQTFVSLKLVDFNDTDQVKFESILTLAESRLDTAWDIVDSAEANFYILNHQNDGLETIPREQCIFCRYNTTDSNDNEIIIADNKIPYLYSMVSLFNHLTRTVSDPIPIEKQSIVAEQNSEPTIQKISKNSDNNFLDNDHPNLAPDKEKNNEFDIDVDDRFNQAFEFEESFESNLPENINELNDGRKHRKAVRYTFDPFEANLKKRSLSGFNKNLTVSILNISSNGVLIELEKPSRLRGKVTLSIQFDSETAFVIPAQVTRNEGKTTYGLQFAESQHELIEYLVINSGLPFVFSQ